jgi:hypothetical protein
MKVRMSFNWFWADKSVNRASNKSKSGRLVSAAKVHFCCFLSELLCQRTPQLFVPCSISFRIDLDPSFSHTGQPGRKQTCFAAYRAVVPLFRPPLFRLGGRQEPLRYLQNNNCNLPLINLLLQKHDDYAQRARDSCMVDVPFLFVYFLRVVQFAEKPIPLQRALRSMHVFT